MNVWNNSVLYQRSEMAYVLMWSRVGGVMLTPTLSVGSSLSCQLSAAGLHPAAAAANSSSKRSSTNFSTSTSDNADDANCTSADVGYVSTVDVTQRRAAPASPGAAVVDRRRQVAHQQPATTSHPGDDDSVEAFPVVAGGRPPGRSTDVDRRRRVEQLPAEVDARTRPTSGYVTQSTSTTYDLLGGDESGQVSGPGAGRRADGGPTTWSSMNVDVILSSLNQRDDVDRGVIDRGHIACTP